MAKNFTLPTKKLHSHGESARVTKFDQIPPALVDEVAGIPLTEDERSATDRHLSKEGQVDKFYRKWGSHFIKKEG